jgi:protein O-GlcNAc transferase
MSETAANQVLEMEEIFRRGAEEAKRLFLERREQTLAQALVSLNENRGDPDAYIAVARSYKQFGQLKEALDTLRQGIIQCAPSPPLYEYYIERLEKCNRTEEAIAAAREAAQVFPDDLIFRLREALLLPVFYDTDEQVNHYRSRYTEGLHRIISEVRLDTGLDQKRALVAIGKNVNKYLPYQGQNDRELQAMYGNWVQTVMAANYPHWAQPVPMPPVNGKIRVGYLSALSARFLNTSVAKLFGGWLREQDRQQFEVIAYHADHRADVMDEQVRRWNLSFRQLRGEVNGIAQAILKDRLHVLVYLDFGMHPRMAQLSALRLAPVQCVVWDTPLTSGIPKIDYFLSSELMEPENAQSHYSEKLIPLPGVGVCFAKPVIPTVIMTRKRRDFGLRQDAVVYLSCQSVFKFLPAQDEVVARIAKQVPDSQFVFLVTNDLVGSDFRNRMDRFFAALGLRTADHCVWLPEMEVLDYWNLNRVADVFLDTLGWSGGVATFEAIACGLPIVTLPGKLMRSRHSYAILSQLGVTETIARDVAAYVEISVRLGLDRQWRQSVIDRMVAGYASLYSDTRCVRALEAFFRSSVEERSRQ